MKNKIEEFNLSDMRDDLFLRLCNQNEEVGLIQTIQEVIRQQDRIFIKKLKDNIVENDIYTVDEIFRIINKLVGELE